MIVCHCFGLTDRDIRAVVRSGAESPFQVAELCGAGADCGGCRPEVRRITTEEASPAPIEKLAADLDFAPA